MPPTGGPCLSSLAGAMENVLLKAIALGHWSLPAARSPVIWTAPILRL